MFIIPINNYNIQCNINSVLYLNCHLNLNHEQCHYCSHPYQNIEHYILNLLPESYKVMDELDHSPIQLGIYYMNGELTFRHTSNQHCLLTLDIILRANTKIFTKIRKSFLYHNKFKCI